MRNWNEKSWRSSKSCRILSAQTKAKALTRAQAEATVSVQINKEINTGVAVLMDLLHNREATMVMGIITEGHPHRAANTRNTKILQHQCQGMDSRVPSMAEIAQTVEVKAAIDHSETPNTAPSRLKDLAEVIPEAQEAQVHMAEESSLWMTQTTA